MKRLPATLPSWLAVAACAGAMVLAIVNASDAVAQTADSAAAATATATAAAATGAEPSAPSPDAEPTATAEPQAHPPAPTSSRDHGIHALYGNAMVPLEWMPPGTAASPVPSEEIFPPQTITIRFNHKKHIKEFKQTCKVCHAAAFSSQQANDRLMPDPTQTCDNCHDVDHSDLSRVETAGST